MAEPINIHHSEQILASLARSGGEPDAHIIACPRCRSLFEFYRAYTAMESVEFERHVTDLDRERVHDVLSPGTYRLEPFRIHLDIREPSPDRNPVLLAALDRSTSATRFVTVAAFASQAIKTVVRILHDGRTGQDSLHVLSADSSYSDRVEIGITDSQGHEFYVRTDEDGVGMMSPHTPVDWTTARVMLVAHASSRS
jgi:hypothetical protein